MLSTGKFCQQFSDPIACLCTKRFPAALINSLKSVLPFDEASVIFYEGSNLPVFDFLTKETTNQVTLDIFVQGAFLLDPYYVAATRQGKQGFFRLRELAPDGFRRSEYYRIYYRQTGLADECGYLISTSKAGFVNIALGKFGTKRFTERQLSFLYEIEPFIRSLCRTHWKRKAPSKRPKTKLRKQLGAALDCFGTSVLTKRESQVVKLILMGHTTQMLAKALDISPETVKLHRKHAYKKLDVRTQSELFYLFIDSLMSARKYRGDDPLLAYMN